MTPAVVVAAVEVVSDSRYVIRRPNISQRCWLCFRAELFDKTTVPSCHCGAVQLALCFSVTTYIVERYYPVELQYPTSPALLSIYRLVRLPTKALESCPNPQFL